MNLNCVLQAISEFLSHPLVIVLIGGLIAAIVGQRLTVSWESRRSSLGHKHQLITDLAEELAKLFSAANLAETKRDSDDPGKVRMGLVEPIQNWTIFSEVFQAKLSAYFPNSQLAKEMNKIHEAAYTFAHLSGLFENDERQEHIDRLVDLLNLRESRHAIDFDLLVDRSSVQSGGHLEVPFARSWRGTRLEIEDLRNKLSQKILATRSLIETVRPTIFGR